MTITVEIPPIATALAAKSEGAVGLWTVTDTRSAFMLSVPATLDVDAKAPAQMSFFRGSDMLFTVASVDDPRVHISTAASAALNGMTRESFELTRVPDSVAGTIPARADPITLFVTAL